MANSDDEIKDSAGLYANQDIQLECGECEDLWGEGEVNMCPLCEATICNYCWDDHYEAHRVAILEESSLSK